MAEIKKHPSKYSFLTLYNFTQLEQPPHSAEKKTNPIFSQDKKNKEFENLLEVYEKIYATEKKIREEKESQKKPKKNHSFHEFGKSDVIKETAEEIIEEFSFKDVNLIQSNRS